MKVGEERHVWIPKGTRSEAMGDYIQKMSKYPHKTFAERKHGVAPHNATHACKYNGKWFKLQMGSTGNEFWTGECLYQGAAPTGIDSANSAPSTGTAASGEVGGRKVDFYFHAYVTDSKIFDLTNAKILVIPAYEDSSGRVWLLHGSNTHSPSLSDMIAPFSQWLILAVRFRQNS